MSECRVLIKCYCQRAVNLRKLIFTKKEWPPHGVYVIYLAASTHTHTMYPFSECVCVCGSCLATLDFCFYILNSGVKVPSKDVAYCIIKAPQSMQCFCTTHTEAHPHTHTPTQAVWHRRAERHAGRQEINVA